MNLHYKKYGTQGPVVIILHGLLGSLDNWHTIAKALSKDFQVYTVDQRNHGRSPHTKTHSYPEMADDLQAFMTQHNLPQAHFIGHSMGGKTAMCFAVTYPQYTGKLIVVDMAPRSYPARHDEILEALKAFPIDEVTSRTEADKRLTANIQDFGVRQFLLKNLLRKPAGGFTWKMNLPVLDHEYQKMTVGVPATQQFEGPTCFIRGGKSNYITSDDETAIRKQFPQAEFVTVSEAGHWVHAEAPEAFLKAVQAFLK